jgi:hypothetical protein
VLAAKSEGEGGAPRGDSSSLVRGGDLGFLHTLFGDGKGLYKATNHGADEDYERVMFYEINGIALLVKDPRLILIFTLGL